MSNVATRGPYCNSCSIYDYTVLYHPDSEQMLCSLCSETELWLLEDAAERQVRANLYRVMLKDIKHIVRGEITDYCGRVKEG